MNYTLFINHLQSIKNINCDVTSTNCLINGSTIYYKFPVY